MAHLNLGHRYQIYKKFKIGRQFVISQIKYLHKRYTAKHCGTANRVKSLTS